MCWPQERPATHAAAGAAARGIRGLGVAPVSGGVLTTGVVMRRRAASGETARGGLVFVFSWRLLRCRREWEREHEGGLIRCAGRPQEWSFGAVPPQERTARGGLVFLFWRTLLPFVLRAVAGACVGRRSGQPRMPPRERQHEELGGLGDLIRCAGRPQEWSFGAVPPQERTARGGLVFFVLADAVAVCFEGCCGSMCWPQERPATHAAAGAAARGIRGIGG